MADIYSANGCEFWAANDMIVAHCLRTREAFEPETTAWMLDVMAHRGGAFVDCGASTGWFSVLMASRGYEVHSFEPNPRVVTRLRENADLNGVFLNVHEAAVSDRTATATLYNNAQLPLTSGASLNLNDCLAPTGKIEVRTVTLDDALPDVVPGLVKIDIEGHELAALRGARGLLAAHKPHLMLEANTEAHRDALAEWLDAFTDYVWSMADGRNMLCSPILPG